MKGEEFSSAHGVRGSNPPWRGRHGSMQPQDSWSMWLGSPAPHILMEQETERRQEVGYSYKTSGPSLPPRTHLLQAKIRLLKVPQLPKISSTKMCTRYSNTRACGGHSTTNPHQHVLKGHLSRTFPPPHLRVYDYSTHLPV